MATQAASLKPVFVTTAAAGTIAALYGLFGVHPRPCPSLPSRPCWFLLYSGRKTTRDCAGPRPFRTGGLHLPVLARTRAGALSKRGDERGASRFSSAVPAYVDTRMRLVWHDARLGDPVGQDSSAASAPAATPHHHLNFVAVPETWIIHKAAVSRGG